VFKEQNQQHINTTFPRIQLSKKKCERQNMYIEKYKQQIPKTNKHRK